MKGLYVCVYDYFVDSIFVGVFESIEKAKETLPDLYTEYTFKDEFGRTIIRLGSYYLYKAELNKAEFI